MEEKIYKFGIVKDNEVEEEFFYNNKWFLEVYPNYKRIIVAPHDNYVNRILELLKKITPPYCILYVLIVSRSNNDPGRYQCSIPLSYDEISNLLIKFREYFEKDGRHHIWLGSVASDEMIVYNHHNVLYLYNMESLSIDYLKTNNFKEEKIVFPVPHSHIFHSEYDKHETDLITNYEWKWFPLQEQDFEC